MSTGLIRLSTGLLRLSTRFACFSVKTFLPFFFRLLYHQFAFTYDLVAAAVSFNRWKDWVMSVLPFIEGNRVLEIGHGPGHLQRALLSQNLFTVGIDESAQMGYLAKRNLSRGIVSGNLPHHSAYTPFKIGRAS